MQRILVTALLIGAAFSAFPEEMPPVVNGGGATLRDLAGTSKLVTVVLEDSGTEDPNLRVMEVNKAHFTVMTLSREEVPYLFASVKEIRVQDGQVAVKQFAPELSRSLRAEEQKVVDRAFRRAKEIFDENADRAPIRMRAAMVMALNNRKEALEYLQSRATSGDVPTELDAVLALYLAGAEDFGGEAVAAGLESGDKKVRQKAIQLAGLLQDESTAPRLMKLVRDRDASINAPAARALGRLGVREVIPRLFRMVMELTAEKGDAAVFALSLLGGEDVVEQAKQRLEQADGLARYRLVLLLYRLGDPLGKKLMVQEMMAVPSLAREAALVLARDAQWDGVKYLMDMLERRYDEEVDVMVYRARAAAALIATGHSPVASDLQEMLQLGEPVVRKQICYVLAALGDRRQIPIVTPLIENSEPDLALTACVAAVAMARPDFAMRLAEFMDE